MEFRDNEPIYQQIVAFVNDHILLGKWPPGDKIPSVRDMAIELEVNPNTVMRAYEFLQNQEIVVNKRGLGLFVAAEGIAKIKAARKERFLEQQLPDLFRNIYLLDISLDEIRERYEQFKSTNYKSPSADNNEKK